MFQAGVVASPSLSTLLRAAETVASFAMEASAATGRVMAWPRLRGGRSGHSTDLLASRVSFGKFGKFD